MEEPTINRTGEIYSFSSVQFLVHFPNNSETMIWSPPWSDLEYDDPEQDEGAMKYAKEIWEQMNGNS